MDSRISRREQSRVGSWFKTTLSPLQVGTRGSSHKQSERLSAVQHCSSENYGCIIGPSYGIKDEKGSGSG